MHSIPIRAFKVLSSWSMWRASSLGARSSAEDLANDERRNRLSRSLPASPLPTSLSIPSSVSKQTFHVVLLQTRAPHRCLSSLPQLTSRNPRLAVHALRLVERPSLLLASASERKRQRVGFPPSHERTECCNTSSSCSFRTRGDPHRPCDRTRRCTLNSRSAPSSLSQKQELTAAKAPKKC